MRILSIDEKKVTVELTREEIRNDFSPGCTGILIQPKVNVLKKRFKGKKGVWDYWFIQVSHSRTPVERIKK